MNIIGIDIGNSRIFCSFIADLNMETRHGGTAHSLLPNEPRYNSGIPSVYFYSQRRGEQIGSAALSSSPRANQRSMIKHRLGQTEVIDGQKVVYDDVFVKLFEHVVRIANETMYNNFRQTTNLVSITYPAIFTHAQLQHMVNLCEKATTDGKTHVKVVGTTPEPVAAALSNLGSQPVEKQDQTVAVIDAGHGTTDFCIARVHLQGKQNNGAVEYYDILAMDGYRQAGYEYDTAMMNLIRSKTTQKFEDNLEYILRNEAERMKIELSQHEVVYADLNDAQGIPLDIAVRREEYEKVVSDMVNRIADTLAKLMNEAKEHKPDAIILTGGQSQMPLIRKRLAERFPEYKDKIMNWKPQQAISFGAARYGVLETGPEQKEPGRRGSSETPVDRVPPVVRKRNQFSIGLQNVVNRSSTDAREANEEHVSIIIAEGTQLPTAQDQWIDFQCLPRRGARLTKWPIYIVEANRKNPDIYQQNQHFKQTMRLELDFGHVIEYEQPFQLCVYVDKNNFVHAIARDSANQANTERHVPVKLLNIE